MYPTNVAIYDLYQEIQGHKGSRKVAKKRRAGNESIVFTQSLTTVNDLPNQFALVRLGKNQKFCYALTVSSYKTLVRRSNVIKTLTCL